MAAVATLLESRSAVQALRRTLPKDGPRVVACRTPTGLRRVLHARLVDAVVLAPAAAAGGAAAELDALRGQLPGIPVLVYAGFRADDGELLLACQRHAVAAVVVEGVDDAVAGDLVTRHSLTTARRRALADAPRVLRLTEPLQRAAWDLLVRDVERPVRTGSLARQLAVSREHLSRQFGAGGAPNLKRVIDLTRVACAAQLLQNPGYSISSVVRLLGYASSSHLAGTTRRIASVPPSRLAELGPRGVLAAFARGNTRSRM
ncbi:MAG TPA: AraC family transcriptional regulator [Gemmatimonadales bacterium]|nr:AraC family transcriptional regulator [Gemmatimonadales bacterium]